MKHQYTDYSLPKLPDHQTIPIEDMQLTCRIGIVVGEFNQSIGYRLLQGSLEQLEHLNIHASQRTVVWVPGAFEIPLTASWLLNTGYDAVIALGAVIRGETPHFDYVAGECARALQDMALHTQQPIIFGVLTTETEDQALARSDSGPNNKGCESATAAIHMLRVKQAIIKAS